MVSYLWRCFLPAGYREVAARRATFLFQHLLLLSVLTTAAISTVFLSQWSQVVRTVTQAVLKDLPVIRIENGHVVTDARQPYLKELDEGVVFLMDTEANPQEIDRDFPNGIFVTKDRIIIKREGGGQLRRQEVDVTTIKRDFVIDQIFVQKVSNILFRVVALITPFFLFVYYFGARLLHVLIFSLLGLWINSWRSARWPYKGLLNIGALALTPSVFLGAISAFAPRPLPLLWVAYLLIYLLFLIRGILTNPQPVASSPKSA